MKLAAFYLLIAVIAGETTARRIVGGTFASDKQFPYQVALFEKDEFVCGGSIIDTKWILTAAHCVVDEYRNVTSNDNLRVLAGTPHLKKGGKYFEPERIIPHETYSDAQQGWRDDIALIKLKEAIVYDETMQKIEFYDRELPQNAMVLISGHGRTGNGEPISELLKYNIMFAVEDDGCRREAGFLTQGLMCFNNKVNNGVCNGDSGGPAVYEGKQVGVANFVLGSCGTIRPDFYAKVPHYATWIAGIMRS